MKNITDFMCNHVSNLVLDFFETPCIRHVANDHPHSPPIGDLQHCMQISKELQC